MQAPQFEDRFVAFIDILGFKSMVEASEAGGGRTVGELIGLMEDLGTSQTRDGILANGPSICPESLRLSPHAGFQLTQASDCAIVSTEVSPAGVVQILDHCWTAAMALLRKGVLIRGYVTRGKVHHAGSVVLGSGYHSAYQREQGVTAFRIEVDEVGTPFIEIDPVVQAYVETETDPCVREMTGRMTRSEGGVMAIYPFSRMSHSIMIGGSGRPFDAGEQKAANGRLRDRVQRYRDAIASQATGGSARAASKIRHYLAALDAQLEIADRTDVFIEGLSAPLTPPYRS